MAFDVMIEVGVKWRNRRSNGVEGVAHNARDGNRYTHGSLALYSRWQAGGQWLHQSSSSLASVRREISKVRVTWIARHIQIQLSFSDGFTSTSFLLARKHQLIICDSVAAGLLSLFLSVLLPNVHDVKVHDDQGNKGCPMIYFLVAGSGTFELEQRSKDLKEVFANSTGPKERHYQSSGIVF